MNGLFGPIEATQTTARPERPGDRNTLEERASAHWRDAREILRYLPVDHPRRALIVGLAEECLHYAGRVPTAHTVRIAAGMEAAAADRLAAMRMQRIQ